MPSQIKPHPDKDLDSPTTIKKKHGYWYWLAPLLCLMLVEIITFGINAKNVGIYQDEWITLSELHFAPHSFNNLISTCFWNPRIIIRPIEALHFGPLFYFAKENPLWYHVTCNISEFFGAWFLFLALSRFTHSRSTAFTAALLYLLYPIHDVTHYEIVASSLPVSFAFFTASLWLYLKGLDENRFSLINLSAFAYFISIYNYEVCLPLVVLYPLFYLFRRGGNFILPSALNLRALKSFILFQTPAVVVSLSMIIYRRWLLPSLGLGYNYATVFSLSNFTSVLWAGWIVSLSPYTVQFSLSMLITAISEGLSIFSLCLLALAICSIFFCILYESSADKTESTTAKSNALPLILLGITTIIFSYTIYGLSPEHKPVIDAWLNRVNLGGALGASMIIAGFLALVKNYSTIISQHLRQNIIAASVAIFSGALIIINWQFAKPWIVSWQAQKQLISLIKSHANEIKSGDSIIIGGIIRYASKWVPVVDGVWDFQGIVRTTLDNEKVNGTVVTERLTMTKDSLIDKYGNILLGSFSFKQMILFDPLKKCWIRVFSRNEFIEKAKKLGWNVPESRSVN